VTANSLIPKLGSLLLARNLPLRKGDAVFHLGAGTSPIGLLAGRRGQRMLATDAAVECTRCTRANSLHMGVADRSEPPTGVHFAPVSGVEFSLIPRTGHKCRRRPIENGRICNPGR
jgi:methylase of polypeptide subunit release factors